MAFPRTSRLILLTLKTSVGIATIWWAHYSGILDIRDVGDALSRPWHLAGGGLLLAATLPLAARRWTRLLAIRQIPLSLGQAFRMVVATTISGAFLPGVIGAEALRAAWLLKIQTRRRSDAILSVFFDRMYGMLGLLVLTALMVPINADVLNVAEIWPLLTLVVGGILVIVLGCQAATALGRRLGLDDELGSDHPRRLYRMIAAAGAYGGSFSCFVEALFLSLLIHCLTVAGFLVIAASISPAVGDMRTYMIALPLSLVANMLPLSPGGIGIGEAAFEGLCRLIAGGAGYATVFLTFRAVSLSVLVILLPTCLGRFTQPCPNQPRSQ